MLEIVYIISFLFLLFIFPSPSSSSSSSSRRHSARFHDAADSYAAAALADLITTLPLQEQPLPSNQFSGYLEVEPGEKYIHYMYFESEGDPTTDPLILWTNGGPGCSGLLGLFSELGPWRPTKDSITGKLKLSINPYSWTKMANVLFVEQPAGVGFSYFTKNRKTLI